MADITKEELETILESAIGKIAVIDKETHEDHHNWIKMQIDKEQRAQERWEKIKVHVLGWGIVALIASLGTWVLKHLRIDM